MTERDFRIRIFPHKLMTSVGTENINMSKYGVFILEQFFDIQVAIFDGYRRTLISLY